jgi:hypothetical protein
MTQKKVQSSRLRKTGKVVNKKKSTTKNTGRLSFNPWYRKPFLFAAIFAVIGVALLAMSMAATTSVSYKGSLTEDRSSESYTVSVGSGTLKASHNSKDRNMRVSIVSETGQVLATSSGSRARTQMEVNPGNYDVRIDYLQTTFSGKKNYTVSIEYPFNDTDRPAVIISSPTAGLISGTTVFEASVTGDSPVSVELYLDSELLETKTMKPYSLSWDTTKYPNGDYQLSAKAYSTGGNVGVASIGVSVNNKTTTVPTDPVPPPTDPVAPATSGLWLSRTEIQALPASGAAWDNVRKAASADWGVANLADLNSLHDTYTLAGALVAVRTGDAALLEKTRQAILSVQNSDYNRVLEMSRNITSYIIAADIIGLSGADNDTFRAFISGLRTKPLQGHSGGKNLKETAMFSSNNWGTMARAAMVAINLYLNDVKDLEPVVSAHRAFLGESVANQLVYSSTNWHPSTSKVGVNRRGSTISGQNVDGVQPEDQRRTGEFAWPAPLGSYPWEALQGTLVAGVMLHRANIVPITAGDDAIYRATDWLIAVNGNPATGDDRWQIWLLNKIRGSKFTTTSTTPGKNMGWTDWTHQ